VPRGKRPQVLRGKGAILSWRGGKEREFKYISFPWGKEYFSVPLNALFKGEKEGIEKMGGGGNNLFLSHLKGGEGVFITCTCSLLRAEGKGDKRSKKPTSLSCP